MSAASASCTICGREQPHSPRYPHAVCASCAARARDASGRPLVFFNQSLSGGYGARYADTGEIYPRHECFIDGVRCRADEARFGGIVIQVVEKPPGERR